MKTLLTIIEQGGYADFTSLYESLGYEVIKAESMRKGLSMLKNCEPEVITAEFIYSPMYSARISNLESLLAILERKTFIPKLIIFSEPEVQHQIQRLDMSKFEADVISYPVTQDKIINILSLEEANN